MHLTKKIEPDDLNGYVLIDPPVGPFSDSSEIRAWIKHLESMADRPEVRESLVEAHRALELAEKGHAPESQGKK